LFDIGDNTCTIRSSATARIKQNLLKRYYMYFKSPEGSNERASTTKNLLERSPELHVEDGVDDN